MRTALVALLALAASPFFQAAPAVAGSDPGPFSFNTPSGYPFCIRTLYDDDDCSYRTYAQCAATASGVGETCFANPALAYSQDPDGQPVTRAKRKRHGNRSY
jgi:hypothetical protein